MSAYDKYNKEVALVEYKSLFKKIWNKILSIVKRKDKLN